MVRKGSVCGCRSTASIKEGDTYQARGARHDIRAEASSIETRVVQRLTWMVKSQATKQRISAAAAPHLVPGALMFDRYQNSVGILPQQGGAQLGRSSKGKGHRTIRGGTINQGQGGTAEEGEIIGHHRAHAVGIVSRHVCGKTKLRKGKCHHP